MSVRIVELTIHFPGTGQGRGFWDSGPKPLVGGGMLSGVGSPSSRVPPSIHALRGSLRSPQGDRKSTRLNSSHLVISYAVFCLKKKKKNNIDILDRLRTILPYTNEQ